MNVLSLFDGLGGGRIALDRAGITVDNYYASEVDKYAIAVAKHNYPDIVELGDVRNWQDWDLPKIDLLIGGSPCQSFSFAGKQNGMSSGNIEVTSLEQYQQLKSDGVEFDGQSYLFWEYVAALRHFEPRWFLLENVKMVKKWETVITRAMGIEPIKINSALVSAQSRKRLYWTNIGAAYDLLGHPYCGIQQPEDRHIYLKDVIEQDACEPMLSNLSLGFGEIKPRTHYGKSVTIRTASGGDSIPSVTKKQQHKYICVASRGRYDGDGDTSQKLEPRNDGKTNAVTTVQKDNLLWIVDRNKSYCIDASYYKGGGLRDYIEKSHRQIVFGVSYNRKDGVGKILDKARSVLASNYRGLNRNQQQTVALKNGKIRKLTPLECERLQTLPDGYTNVPGISKTQRYKMIGNGWTIDVIEHIFSYLRGETK